MPPVTMTMLALDNAQCLLRKISINVLNQDAEQTLFTIPCEGVPLTREQLNAYMGEFTFESWFNQDARTKLYSPMPWVLRLPKGEIAIEDEFEADGAELIVSGGKTLVFEADEDADGDDEDDDRAPPVRVTSIRLKPTAGGVTLLAFHLQVRPGLGKDNLTLQEHQFRQVKLTLGNTTLAERKGRQSALNFGEQTPAAGETNGNSETSSSSSTNGADPEFENAAKRQVEAFNAKPGQLVDGRSERVKERDRKRGVAH
ncbi:MAG: hypothetical protein ACREUT_15550 [Steroidobacteraceae bacterium]